MKLWRARSRRGVAWIPFSAVSKPMFTRKYSFESSRRDLHNTHFCTDLRYQISSKESTLVCPAENEHRASKTYHFVGQNSEKILEHAFLIEKRIFCFEKCVFCTENAYSIRKTRSQTQNPRTRSHFRSSRTTGAAHHVLDFITFLGRKMHFGKSTQFCDRTMYLWRQAGRPKNGSPPRRVVSCPLNSPGKRCRLLCYAAHRAAGYQPAARPPCSNLRTTVLAVAARVVR